MRTLRLARPAERRVRRSLLAGLALLGSVAIAEGAGAADSLQPAASRHTVLLGVGGLRWSDLSPEQTPTLWGLLDRSSVGSISVRTVKAVTCPIDAWLTISTGQRSLGSPSDSSAPCAPLPRIADGRVHGWRSYVDLQRGEVSSYGEPGRLGDLLGRSGRCALAVGPGAAVALATSDGRVERYTPMPSSGRLGECPLTVVDAGSLPARAPARGKALAALDSLVARLAAQSPPATLFVTGVADTPGGEPGLGAALRYEAGRAPGWLTSNSTRRTGLIQLTDLTATALAAAGSTYAGIDGAPVVSEGSRGLDTAATVRDRLDFASLTESLSSMAVRLGVTYLLLTLLPLALVAAVWRRRRQHGVTPALPAAWRTAALAVSVAAAATPVSAYLPTLVSWWTTSRPTLSLLAAAGVVIAVVTLLALAPVPRLRGEVWGPALVVSAVTFAVLTIDALAGTPLHVASPLVSGPVTGGRFYGFSNVTFAVYATSALLLAGALVELVRPPIGVGGRRAAGAVVASVAVVAVLVDGLPTLGADFGGILAMLPGFGYLALVVLGRRVTLRGAAALAGVAVAVTVAVSVLDWLRPDAQRSHFGSFVQKVLDGEASDIVVGKAAAALHTVVNPAGLLALIVLVAAVAFVIRPYGMAPATVAALWTAWPALLPTLRAVAIVAVLGTLLNDSGVLVAGAMLATAIPLVLAAVLRLPVPRPEPEPAASPQPTRP